MSVSKDAETNTWTVQCYYTDWTGSKKHKKKRNFATKKEAQEWEREFLQSQSADLNMSMEAFVEIYFGDKAGELKERTRRNKRYLLNAHVLPYFQNKSMSAITPSDIIRWQNEISKKGYKDTYLRMIQNQQRQIAELLDNEKLKSPGQITDRDGVINKDESLNIDLSQVDYIKDSSGGQSLSEKKGTDDTDSGGADGTED